MAGTLIVLLAAPLAQGAPVQEEKQQPPVPAMPQPSKQPPDASPSSTNPQNAPEALAPSWLTPQRARAIRSRISSRTVIRLGQQRRLS
jgi:uncharacterized membrane protein